MQEIAKLPPKQGAGTVVASLRQAELALMNAPFDENGWQRAMELVAAATGSGAVHLAAIGGPMMMPLDIFVGREAHRIDQVFAAPELCGEGNWRLRAVGELMTIQHERHYAEARALGGSSAYDDAVSSLDMQLGCQSTLINDSRNFLGLALIRGRREGATDETVYSRFSHLLHHVQRSVRVQLALGGEAAEVLLGEMATVECRVMLLDRHGCLSAVTGRAEALLDEIGPARLDGLAVGLRDREENRQLHRAMGRLLADRSDAPMVHQMRAGRAPCSPNGRWKLSLIRLPDRPDGLGFDPALALSFQPLADQCHPLEAGQAVN